MSHPEANHPKFISLQLQPNFPSEDLSASNTEILKHTLPKSAGVDAYALELQTTQRYIHQVADRALKFLGIKTAYSQQELHSFSHGFTGFDVINDLVHPPRLYDMALARSCIERFFVDTRSLFDIELEEFEHSLLENRPVTPVSHDRSGAEIELANHHNVLAETRPNTYEVILAMGVAKGESMAQLQTRVAGATLAYCMQTTD